MHSQARAPEIRRSIQQDLNDARALLEQSGTDEQRKKYRRAAEIILLEAVSRHPENKEAKALLQCAWNAPDSPPETPAEVPFVAPASSQPVNETKKSRAKLSYVVIGIVVLAAGFRLMLQPRPADPSAPPAPVAQTEPFKDFARAPVVVAPVAPAPVDETQASVTPIADPLPAAAPAPEQPVVSAQPIVVVTPPITVTASLAPSRAPSPAPSPDPASAPKPAAAVKPAKAAAMGSLAVNSATPADIYMGDRYMGSTPTTLSLPAGMQRLEYRRGDLRTVVTHKISPAETTTASVTFEITVQINANPWAQVFLDGPSPRPLGETPLSRVTVPIGGILVFQNPRFASKRYRITGRDAAIQVSFP